MPSIKTVHDHHPFALEDGVDWLQWRLGWLIDWQFWLLFAIFQAWCGGLFFF
jgi:hypothetical protein